MPDLAHPAIKLLVTILKLLNSAVGLTDINKSNWQIPNTHDYYGKSHNFYVGLKVGIMYNVKRFHGKYW